MDVSSMLSNDAQDAAGTPDTKRQMHAYPTRNGSAMPNEAYTTEIYSPAIQRPLRGNGIAAAGSGYPRASPVKKGQKHVVFQLIDLEDPRIQARLPMRVMISQNDNTESIVTTVKNFYGLYEFGVSFENKDGVSIIAAYDNFENDMVVYVRIVAPPAAAGDENVHDSVSPKKPSLGAPFEMRPTLAPTTHSPSRAAARSAGARSLSPQSEVGRRSASAAPAGKPRPHRTKSKDSSLYGEADGYSSGDNGGGSVASSRRSKAEQVNAEISVENIVEGGRRKRAFESSELPLFVPPQVPISASISSISPQRRNGPPNIASPYTYSNQQTFSYVQPLPSPQSYGGGAHHFQNFMPSNSISNAFPYPNNRQLRGSRPSGVGYPPARQSIPGVLPTPDPTVGSAISDEDVALQLMRLGDPMAFSHGRTSTSTVDDALSGKADAASSDEESDDDDEDEDLPSTVRYSREDVGPQRKKQRLMNELPSDGTSGEEYEDQRDGTFAASDDGTGQRKMHKSKPGRPRSNTAGMNGFGKIGKPRANSMVKPKQKSSMSSKMPMSPSSMPAPSRKASIASTINFQHQLGTDEEDLSSKPRCQRCRKSKKGCDRQRPCGRCKDAGIGIEGCISEDEGNGRKGRYGRHMGVTIKKAEDSIGGDMSPPTTAASSYGFMGPPLSDKSKKRKRLTA